MTDVPPFQPADITPYLDLITSEHQPRPKFIASVTALLQPMADILQTLEGMNEAFDLDTAVGDQLDVCGEWIGAERCLLAPLPGVWFSWDTENLGWDQGHWLGAFDPVEGQRCLDDETYRNYLRATILANRWDGSIPQLYEILSMLLGGAGSYWLLDDDSIQMYDLEGVPIGDDAPVNFLIQDNGDMTFYLVITGPVDAVSLALITGGYLKIKPAGVEMIVIQPSVQPYLFGWDMQTGQVGGWGIGSWPTKLAVL